jgi:hypothetical protein
VHELVRTDNGVDRTCVAAVKAANARGLIDNGHRRYYALGQGNNFSAKQTRKPPNRVIAAGRAEVDCSSSVDHRRSIRSAPGVATLGALRLRQQFIDLFHEVTIIRW